MKMNNAVVFRAFSFGQKKLAKYSYLAIDAWPARSPLIRGVHIIERIGLAMAGGAGGLYVAIGLMRTGNELLGTELMVLLMMLYGAIGFYFGIDLPGSLAQRVGPTRPEKWSFGTDAAVIASAAGTFLAASAAFLSVGVIVLDGTMRGEFSVFVACSWAIGTSFQIAAGAIGRSKVIVEDGSE
jgi:hypothetical protein